MIIMFNDDESKVDQIYRNDMWLKDDLFAHKTCFEELHISVRAKNFKKKSNV
jgi:hypothetical protein